MSPQRSNRDLLIEGALRCLERLPADRVSARAIVTEAGANLASIGYHFGSKDELVTEAVILGLDRWLDDIAARLDQLPARTPVTRFQRAWEAVEASSRDHTGLARNFIGALARAQHDPRIAQRLFEGFRRTRPAVAALLGLGDDQAGDDAGGLVLAMFDGLLFQSLLDPGLAIEGDRMRPAQARLGRVLPGPD